LCTPISLCPICRSLLTFFPVPGKRKRDKKMERVRKKKRNWRKYQDLKGATLPSFLSHDGAGLDLFLCYAEPPAKTCEAWVYGTAELEACWVPEDPALPAPAEGYVVSFMAFYEQGFGMPQHWFHRSLLRYYGLELHHLTPVGVLHIIAAFVTLCGLTWGSTLNLICGTTFFTSNIHKILKWS
jgi:hypothetical protein